MISSLGPAQLISARGLEFDKEGKVTSKKYGKAWCCTDLPGDGSSDVFGVEVQP
jgi:hypothetical protein